MFSLKIDVDNKGGRVWTTGEPDEIYGAIGTVTVSGLVYPSASADDSGGEKRLLHCGRQAFGG